LNELSVLNWELFFAEGYYGGAPATAGAAFMAEMNYARVFFQNRFYDFSLDADAFAVDDAKVINSALEAFVDVVDDDVFDLFGLELVEVKSAIDGVFDGLVVAGIGHIYICRVSQSLCSFGTRPTITQGLRHGSCLTVILSGFFLRSEPGLQKFLHGFVCGNPPFVFDKGMGHPSQKFTRTGLFVGVVG